MNPEPENSIHNSLRSLPVKGHDLLAEELRGYIPKINGESLGRPEGSKLLHVH